MQETPVPDFRVYTVESERGWKTEYDYSYFDTFETANEFFNNNRPTREFENRVPDYYFISQHIEKFNPIRKEWERV